METSRDSGIGLGPVAEATGGGREKGAAVRKERDSGFELLRLLLMFLIVVHHGIVHGVGLSGLASGEIAIRPGDVALYSVANGFCIVAVNVFVLMSGYFGIRPTWEKALRLLLAIVFYTLLFTTTYYLVHGDARHTISSLLFFSHSRYWFLTDYFFLLCFVVPLNAFFERYGKRETGMFVSALLVISIYFGFVWGHPANTNGYTLLQFIMLYSLGRYVRLNGGDVPRRFSAGLYLGGAAACGAATYACYLLGQDAWAWKMTYYNNPLVVAAALGLLLFFRKVHFYSRTVNRFTASALAVYLFSSSAWFESWFYPFVKNSYRNAEQSAECFAGGGTLLQIVCIALGCVVAALAIDWVQLWLNGKLIRRILKKFKRSGFGPERI